MNKVWPWIFGIVVGLIVIALAVLPRGPTGGLTGFAEGQLPELSR